jgi:phosphocarrier protein
MKKQDTGVNTIERSITINNRYGLHARPAALFVELCNRFESEIVVEKNGTEVNGKNILDVMMLGAGMGSVLLLRVTGRDAEAAAQALMDLIESNFGEEKQET